jgi:hypothetical protein
MENNTPQFVAGTVKWFKALGEPRMDEMAGRKMWAFDFYPDDPEAMAKTIKAQKINKTLKDKGEGKFLGLSRNELTAKGEKNKPIPIVDADGNPWDQEVNIGNGSKVIVRYRINGGSKYGNLFWVDAVKVVEHVPYEGGNELFPKDIDKGDWADDLNDDVAF